MAGKIVGKKLIIYYEDGTQRVNRVEGICTSDSSDEVVLDNDTIIPKGRVVRIEIQGGIK